MGARILIVEDDPATQQYLQNLLEGEGYACIPCSTAEQAIEICDQREPALAVIDIALPGEHGVSLTNHLRCHTPSVPVIIFSAVLGQWDEEDIRDCGASAILAKPSNARQLLYTVRTLLRISERYTLGDLSLHSRNVDSSLQR